MSDTMATAIERLITSILGVRSAQCEGTSDDYDEAIHMQDEAIRYAADILAGRHPAEPGAKRNVFGEIKPIPPANIEVRTGNRAPKQPFTRAAAARLWAAYTTEER